MAVFAASYALLGALTGLTLGVKMPVLTWTDQLMPIKQSAPVMLTLFGGMGYTILLFAGFLLLPGWALPDTQPASRRPTCCCARCCTGGCGKRARRCLPPCDGAGSRLDFSGEIAIIPLTNTC